MLVAELQMAIVLAVEERDVLRLQVGGAIGAAIGAGGCVVPSLGDIALPRVEKERDDAIRARDEEKSRVNGLLQYARACGGAFKNDDEGIKWI